MSKPPEIPMIPIEPEKLPSSGMPSSAFSAAMAFLLLLGIFANFIIWKLYK